MDQKRMMKIFNEQARKGAELSPSLIPSLLDGTKTQGDEIARIIGFCTNMIGCIYQRSYAVGGIPATDEIMEIYFNLLREHIKALTGVSFAYEFCSIKNDSDEKPPSQ